MTIENAERQLDRATKNGDAAAPQLTAATRETTSALNPCSRCGNVRPLTHRVRSDLVEQTVCEACAAEVPLATTGVGELTVERIHR